ncbi:hypothetical protein GCM10011331_11580 [Flavimobilis marinus]|uniref:Uncharacterized membrane protein n=1 Tax=Flavimobilis marinus TaxID=285351 RepID=A0A1I2HYA6_9MICO|nr:DUF2254 domain-containing protein [Flavimobilis marinus]GHG49222.1 hypothetical protein GCM10011331_11580 [Flavimobilis marinus]SFF33626.1 Uncharacterized membrane protein [Flavimobilis marinus]
MSRRTGRSPEQREPRFDRSSAELWKWPTTGAIAAAVLALLLAPIRPDRDTMWLRTLWPGDIDNASAVLQVMAGASMTTITLTFSLTVVALQLASQQFSPRLLRDFVRDRVTKAVLTALVSTFVYSLILLRTLGDDLTVPVPAMTVGALMGLGSLAAVLAFITHITSLLRVDTMMRTVHEETSAVIDAAYQHRDQPAPPSPDGLALDDPPARRVCADRSGFVSDVDVDRLVSVARSHHVLVRVVARPGDHVVSGTPIAEIWDRPGSVTGDADEPERLGDEVRGAISLDYERTTHADPAFGLRQLTDIAVKALSPGINDPVTAAHAIGHNADVLVRLVHSHLGPRLYTDDDGAPRVVVGDRDLRYFLDLACGQVRRYGRREPTVLGALLRMLRDVAMNTRDLAERAEIERQTTLVLDEMTTDLLEPDQEDVRRVARQVRAVLADDSLAYRDRSGETRSI